MLEVKVTLEIPGVPEALDRLADAIASQGCKCKPDAKAADPLTAAMDAAKVEAPVAQPAPTQTAAAAPAAPEPVQTPAAPSAPIQTAPASAPAPQPTPAPTAQPAPAPASAKKYTRDEIAHAGSALVSQGKMPQLLALLNKYGVQSVVQLDPNKYDEFVADLKALGAAL